MVGPDLGNGRVLDSCEGPYYHRPQVCSHLTDEGTGVWETFIQST